MAEVAQESTHVWTHKARIAIFLIVMRLFRDALREKGWTVYYRELDKGDSSLSSVLIQDLDEIRPESVVMPEAGEYRVEHALKTAVGKAGWTLDIVPDDHFLCSREEFADYAQGRKSLRMEYFYRDMRKRYEVLMDDGKPEGGDWNYDADNRKSFPKSGPPHDRTRFSFKHRKHHREVFELIEARFPDHPGSLEQFNWPVTRDEALQALDHFIREHLPHFGDFQDAMWTEEPFLYHSMLSSSINLKLLDPLEVVRAAEQAYHDGRRNIPLAAVEGFIRQILGWREYVRGVYWLHMPDYLHRNELDASEDLPGFYWTAETDMHCMQQAIRQTLEVGYAHHIQRLMVTGLFGLLYGVDPRQIHEWYLAVYVDAVEWVELPNTLGMSQFADGGIMGSKPYAATGKYIQRMSNYCKGCRYDPAKKTGEDACPFTTLYWDFLLRHEEKLKKNPRMKLQVRNVDRLDASTRDAVRQQADGIRKAGKP